MPLTASFPISWEAVLDGRRQKGLRLAEMLKDGPLTWEEQRSSWFSNPTITVDEVLDAGVWKTPPFSF